MSNTADWWHQLANYMPTGTFLVFSTAAGLTFNAAANGACDHTQQLIFGLLVVFIGAFCAFSAFTDAIQYRGKTVHVIARIRGRALVLDRFPEGAVVDPQHPNDLANALDAVRKVDWRDWVHAVTSTAVFATLALLVCEPVRTCFFGVVHPTVVRVVPVVVAFLAAVVFTKVLGKPRHGLGFGNLIGPSDDASSFGSNVSSSLELNKPFLAA